MKKRLPLMITLGHLQGIIHPEIPQPDYVEVNFYMSEEPNIYTALLAAAEKFASKYTGFPDQIVMNTERRLKELPADYWHTVYHGPIAIKLYSPYDKDVDETVYGVECGYGTFISVRRTSRVK